MASIREMRAAKEPPPAAPLDGWSVGNESTGTDRYSHLARQILDEHESVPVTDPSAAAGSSVSVKGGREPKGHWSAGCAGTGNQLYGAFARSMNDALGGAPTS
jgi:hypothetical protein